jgi:hypothetical protein
LPDSEWRKIRGGIGHGGISAAANDIGHVAAENTAVLVHFIDNNELEILKQLNPLGVMG